MKRGTDLRSLLVVLLLCLICVKAHAVGLSDAVSFGDVKALAQHGFIGSAKAEVLKGRVGTVDEKMPCLASGPKAGDAFGITMNKTPGKACTIQVQEVYPPDSEGVRYTYQVYANKKLIYIRDYPGVMFSRVSYFIKLDDPGTLKASKVSLRFVNRSGKPFRIASVRAYSDFDAYCKGFAVPFYLTPMSRGRGDDAKLDEELGYLKTNIRPTDGTDVKLAYGTEVYYMHRDEARAKTEFEAYLRVARKHDVPMEYHYVSWWGGTPMRIDDGHGGKFSDPKYQQVCWSETDTYDDPGLREFLGDKWDIRYGWTVPNQWSSTPWLTMNSDVLNQAKWDAIARSYKALSEVMSQPGASKYLLGFSMENEPRYWDNYCPPAKYPVERKDLKADFNPLTVAAAAKDGVTLDPKDGLDLKERKWLHENVARYQQQFYDAHARSLRKLDMPYIDSKTDAPWRDVYSHAFTGPAYPMDKVTKYHPVLEWNRLRGCRAGLEDLTEPLIPYADVTREWGRWSQVNYEENNGRSIEWHIRVLRACYAYGARFYAFYNWQSINGEGRWTEYVQEFCADGPVAMVCETKAGPGASFKASTAHAFAVDMPVDWPFFNDLSVSVDKPGEYMAIVYDDEKKGRALGYRLISVSKPGSVRFTFPNSIPVEYGGKPYILVSRVDSRPFGLRKNANGGPVVTLAMDYSRERMQSMMMTWRADARSLISDLGAQKSKLAAANKLLNAGDYRKAYEAAIRVERDH